MLKNEFLMRGEVIWEKGPGAGVSTAWGSWMSATNPTLRDTHEYIMIFSKGKFNRKKGKSTITRDEFLEYTKSVWCFGPERAKKVNHPAPFQWSYQEGAYNSTRLRETLYLIPFVDQVPLP